MVPFGMDLRVRIHRSRREAVGGERKRIKENSQIRACEQRCERCQLLPRWGRVGKGRDPSSHFAMRCQRLREGTWQVDKEIHVSLEVRGEARSGDTPCAKRTLREGMRDAQDTA